MFEGKRLRDRLRAGEICLGIGTASSDPCEAELLSLLGFDFLLIDSEHGALNIESVQQVIMATKGTDVAAIVRVPWNDPVRIKPVLDAGAAGVVVPLVNTAQEARLAVAACMYPPVGVRGYGPRRPSNYEREAEEYIAKANDNLTVWVQIEHQEAVNNVEEIVRTPGLNGVLIGSNDLSASMGLLGQPRHPRVLEAIAKTIAAGKEAGMPVGMAGPGDPQAAFERLQEGLQFIILGSATSFMASATEAALSRVQQLIKERG